MELNCSYIIHVPRSLSQGGVFGHQNWQRGKDPNCSHWVGHPEVQQYRSCCDLKFWCLNDLKSWCLNADGEHGLLLRGVITDAIRLGDAPAFDGCCLCCLCGKAHSQEGSTLDWHAQASHRLQRVGANVRPHCQLPSLPKSCNNVSWTRHNDLLLWWFQGMHKNARERTFDCTGEQVEGRLQEVFQREVWGGRTTSTGRGDLQINEDKFVLTFARFYACLKKIWTLETVVCLLGCSQGGVSNAIWLVLAIRIWDVLLLSCVYTLVYIPVCQNLSVTSYS